MNDREIARAVRDAHAVPPEIPFARVLAGARARRSEPPLRIAPRIAFAAALILLLAAALAPPRPTPAVEDPLARWNPPTDFLLARSSIESPTDFLLRQGESP